MGLNTKRIEYAALDDEVLLNRARVDLEAFGELVHRHQDFVFGAAMRVVRDPVLAEDIAQDTFVRAWRALPDFRGESHVRSWLYRIASNLALNAVTRKREFAVDTVGDRPDVGGAPEREAELVHLRADLRAAIEALPDNLRSPLELRELRGMSYQDISDELDLPLNTVRTRILRARRALQGAMKDWR